MDDGLTQRESETIRLLAEGLSNHEIARRLHLSVNSIKTYLRTAYRTMGVTSRSRALLWALTHGLGPDDCAAYPDNFGTSPPRLVGLPQRLV